MESGDRARTAVERTHEPDDSDFASRRRSPGAGLLQPPGGRRSGDSSPGNAALTPGMRGDGLHRLLLLSSCGGRPGRADRDAVGRRRRVAGLRLCPDKAPDIIGSGTPGHRYREPGEPGHPRLGRTAGKCIGRRRGQGYVYVASGDAGLQVVDARNPGAPVIVGSVVTPGPAREVAVSGHHAYVAGHNSGLQVVDIADPSSPEIVGSVSVPGLARGVAVSGRHAYVAADEEGLHVIDV